MINDIESQVTLPNAESLTATHIYEDNQTTLFSDILNPIIHTDILPDASQNHEDIHVTMPDTETLCSEMNENGDNIILVVKENPKDDVCDIPATAYENEKHSVSQCEYDEETDSNDIVTYIKNTRRRPITVRRARCYVTSALSLAVLMGVNIVAWLNAEYVYCTLITIYIFIHICIVYRNS